MFQLLPNDPKIPEVREVAPGAAACLHLKPAQEKDMPRRQTRGSAREAIQDPDPGSQTVSTRRT
jgi:hypothetical protein